MNLENTDEKLMRYTKKYTAGLAIRIYLSRFQDIPQALRLGEKKQQVLKAKTRQSLLQR